MYIQAKYKTEPLTWAGIEDRPLTFEISGPEPFKAVVNSSSHLATVNVWFEHEVDAATDALLERYFADRTWPTIPGDKKILFTFSENMYVLAGQRAERVIRTLRWQIGDIGPNKAVTLEEISSSRDQTSWLGFPPRKPGPLELLLVPDWDPAIVEREVADLVAKAKHWPVGLELLEEAWGLRYTAPRSAILIGVAAIEVAIKEFISDQVPIAEWLAFEAPTPPIHKILKDYLPTIPNGNPRLCDRIPRLPDSVVKTIEAGNVHRNKLAHRGEMIPSNEAVRSLLIAAKETIWLLEWCKGLDTAWYFMPHGTRIEHLILRCIADIKLSDRFIDDEKKELGQVLSSALSAKTDPFKKLAVTLDKFKDRLPSTVLEILRGLGCNLQVE